MGKVSGLAPVAMLGNADILGENKPKKGMWKNRIRRQERVWGSLGKQTRFTCRLHIQHGNGRSMTGERRN